MDKKEALKSLFDRFGSMQIIQEYFAPTFYEFVCNRHGDIVIFRVYQHGEIVER